MANTVSSAVNAVKRVAVNTFGVDAFTTSGGSGLVSPSIGGYHIRSKAPLCIEVTHYSVFRIRA